MGGCHADICGKLIGYQLFSTMDGTMYGSFLGVILVMLCIRGSVGSKWGEVFTLGAVVHGGLYVCWWLSSAVVYRGCPFVFS